MCVCLSLSLSLCDGEVLSGTENPGCVCVWGGRVQGGGGGGL